MTDITTLIFNPEELEEWLDHNTCSPLTANAIHFTVRGYHACPSAAAEMLASKYKDLKIKPVFDCRLCRGTGEIVRGKICKCITEQEKKIITDKSSKINKDSKKSMSKSNFCLQSSEKSVTYCFCK